MGRGAEELLLGGEELADMVDLLQDLLLLVFELLCHPVADIHSFFIIPFGVKLLR